MVDIATPLRRSARLRQSKTFLSVSVDLMYSFLRRFVLDVVMRALV